MLRTGKLKLGLTVVLLIALLAFLGGCVPPEGGGEGGFDWTILIFIGLIIGVFYFLMIRPQRKRQKEHEELMIELQRGDKVITAGGIYGTVESLSDESVVLKIESGVTIRIARSSVIGRREK
ncbi:MAG: preprotein translocase subunit YajC [Dehalococcoidales bacterium]|jgi:preprotein translocase subunit YajC|nr:preprotein translocase subunit YajC [Dehalococcoidales bacterium]MDP6577248.1 preprotein translocase subunit YajC [Dehalococcoidales bacterium]MDP6824631.1 preprotein translocase subunit YajC [Dehalococcoidales bacterium]MDP7286152.1 preprotein translocase subunit YajC [Dehalococcoidales bacterium]MDP7415596.1 preprotein translocase subunit YajC [Dehalococcoidales bacterium]|tara:strand:- start:282 stop:647 length:366 start_codon:yes stop_codon:yes gene_type:complete